MKVSMQESMDALLQAGDQRKGGGGKWEVGIPELALTRSEKKARKVPGLQTDSPELWNRVWTRGFVLPALFPTLDTQVRLTLGVLGGTLALTHLRLLALVRSSEVFVIKFRLAPPAGDTGLGFRASVEGFPNLVASTGPFLGTEDSCSDLCLFRPAPR